MLVLCEKDLTDIYDEFLELPAVAALLSLFDDEPEEIFPYGKDIVVRTPGSLLRFCQDILEWACLYDISRNSKIDSGDFILRDGPLRSLNIKQRYFVKTQVIYSTARGYGWLVSLSRVQSKRSSHILLQDRLNYLQSKLKANFPFSAKDPKSQKLCCYFEVRDDVLESAYAGNGSNMYAKKGITGGRSGFSFRLA